MTRTTMKTLLALVDHLNEVTGNPTEIWTRTKTGNKAHVGPYVLDAAYGGYRLCQVVSDGCAEREITPRSGARETADLIYAYMRGLKDAAISE